MSLSTVEQKIVADYGAVKAWIALHIYSSVLIALVVGGAVGHFI